MDKIIYILCTATALACTLILLRSYMQSRAKILFWSGVSFAALAASNLLLLLDKTVFLMTADLLPFRLIVALVAIVCLLYGMLQGER